MAESGDLLDSWDDHSGCYCEPDPDIGETWALRHEAHKKAPGRACPRGEAHHRAIAL